MSMRSAYKPHLKAWLRHRFIGGPDTGQIEQPGGWQNIVWQRRSREPDVFERRLVQALEEVFGQGAQELHELVERLNQVGVQECGELWVFDSFQQNVTRPGY